MALKTTKELEIQKVSSLITQKFGRDFSINVKFLADVSGSLQWAYRDGRSMENLLQRLIAFSDQADPDKSVQVFAFSGSAGQIGTFNTSNFDSPISMFTERSWFWGSTNYAAGFDSIREARTARTTGMFGLGSRAVESDEPELIFFLTDGRDYGSRGDLLSTLKALINKNCFVIAVGVGDPHEFQLLSELDNLLDGFTLMLASDFAHLDGDAFYDRVLMNVEFSNWLKAKGIV